MNTGRLCRLLGITLSLAALALPRVGSAATPQPMSAEEASYAAELTRLINQERQARNLVSLGENAALTRATVLYAQVLGQPGVSFSHTGPDGSTPPARANAQGYNAGTFFATSGENLALNYPDPGQCFAAWMASPGHRDNIIVDMAVPTANRRHLAVGVCISGGKTIAVAMFGIQQFLVDPGTGPKPTPTPTPRPTPVPVAPTPQVVTLSVPAGAARNLAVSVPAFARARSLSITVSGQPLVRPVLLPIAAGASKSVTLPVPASMTVRSAVVRVTDGPRPVVSLLATAARF